MNEKEIAAVCQDYGWSYSPMPQPGRPGSFTKQGCDTYHTLWPDQKWSPDSLRKTLRRMNDEQKKENKI